MPPAAVITIAVAALAVGLVLGWMVGSIGNLSLRQRIAEMLVAQVRAEVEDEEADAAEWWRKGEPEPDFEE